MSDEHPGFGDFDPDDAGDDWENLADADPKDLAVLQAAKDGVTELEQQDRSEAKATAKTFVAELEP